MIARIFTGVLGIAAGLFAGTVWSVAAAPAAMSIAQAKAAGPTPAPGSEDIATLRRRMQLDPENADIRYRLARQLAFKAEYAESIRLFTQLVAANDKDPDYRLGLGQALLWSGKPADALVPLRAAARLAPRYEDVYRALGQALTTAGRSAEAKEHYQQSAKRFPKAAWPGAGLVALEGATNNLALAARDSPPASSASIAPPTARAPVAPVVVAEIAAGVSEAAPPIAGNPSAAVPVATIAYPATATELNENVSSRSRTLIDVGLSREKLSTNTPDWREEYIAISYRSADRTQTGSAKIARTERFGASDATATLSGAAKLASNLTGSAEMAISSTHRIQPKRSLQAGLSLSLTDGWGVGGGLKQVTYNASVLRVADVTLERYWGNYRVAYSIHPTHSNIAGSALGHRLQMSRYYGDDNSVSLLFAAGSEVDRPEVGIFTKSTVRAVALFGQHGLSGSWALGYALSHTSQAGTRRDGFSLSAIYKY